MFSKSIILPALAIAGGVSAQCSTSATLTIQNAGDAGALSGCRTYTGSIAIATGATDAISIAGVQQIQGSLNVSNVPGLPSLQADSLQSIEGSFVLANTTVLTSLNFPRLSKVGTIDWVTVPNLYALAFTTGVKETQNVRIVDTALGSLAGIQLSTVDRMIISSNSRLQVLNMPLENIKTLFRAEFNSQTMNVTLPNLEYVYNATFRNVSGVSFPSLKVVNDSMGFTGNFFSSLSAPNLTSIGTTLSVISNSELTNVSFPQLTKLGGAISIANNTKLYNITGFPLVATVRGAVDVVGNFTDFTLPALGQTSNGGSGIDGAFNLQSQSNIQPVCDRFQPLVGRSNPIKGQFTCKSTDKPVTTDGQAGSANGGGSSGSSSPTGAAPRDFSARSYAVTGALGLVAAVLAML